MEIILKGESKEIAALFVAIQERQSALKVVEEVTDGLRQKFSSSHTPEQFEQRHWMRFEQSKNKGR